MAKDTDKKPKVKEKVSTPIKRELQNQKRRLINKMFKSRVRTTVRNFESSLATSDTTQIQTTLNDVYSMMDKAAKRGIYKLNKASRLKSRFTARAAAKIGV